MVVVDGQVHVWAAATAHRPWAPGADTYADQVANLSSAQRPPLSPAELSGEMAAAGVDRAVLVPPTFEGDRNDVALAAARERPDRFAVMGRLALTDPAARALLPTWCDQPGMLGVRLTFHWGEQRRWLTDGTADWFWPAAQDAAVPVMVYAPGQLDLVADIAARHPGLSLVVDHFGLPLAARDEHLPDVVARLVAMAGLPNVAVKASALPSFTRSGYPFRPLHDPIHRVLDAFGPDRVFWGSEMSRLRCSYREAVTLFTEELDFLGGRDLELVMGGRVERVVGVVGVIVTDAQVHVWPPESPDRPWPPGSRAFAHGDSLPVDRLLAGMAAARVDTAVLVPPSFEGDRNDVCLAAAAAYPERFRVMGRIAVTDPTLAARLPAWRDQPGMLGVRLTFANGPSIGWLTDGTADWLWPAAEAAGLPVMVFAPGNTAEIGRIAARHPDLRLVVDHLGVGTKLRDAAIDPAIAAVLALAHHRNVAVKATCLPAMVTDGYPFRSLHERVHRVLDAFGPRRVFWGSDLSRLPCGYDEVRRLFTDELDFLSGDDLEWVLGRGVRTWLGWTGH